MTRSVPPDRRSSVSRPVTAPVYPRPPDGDGSPLARECRALYRAAWRSLTAKPRGKETARVPTDE